MCAHSADAPLVAENTIDIVSRDHGAPPGVTLPPHKSTTVRPSSEMQRLAPSSSRCSKFSTKLSSTWLNFGSHSPSMRPPLVAREILLLLMSGLDSSYERLSLQC